MKVYLREEWIKNPQLKHFSNHSVISNHKKKCDCIEPELIELWEHDSCFLGRIDTTFCVSCNQLYSYKIVR